MLEAKTVHVSDVLADDEYTLGDVQKIAGYRAALGVPLLREGNVVGVIFLARSVPHPFNAKQIELASTFADQAVIAIENVRLFDEVQARTTELARSVEELRALGEVSQAVNSTLDLETVLATIVAKAVQLSNTDAGVIYVLDEVEQTLRVRATYGLSDELVEAIRGQPAGASDASAGRSRTDNHWRSQILATSRQAQYERSQCAPDFERASSCRWSGQIGSSARS